MAVMADAERLAVWAQVMRDISSAQESCAIDKPALRAAINAIDQWISDNAASFNAALPVAARNGLTAPQKVRLFAAVLFNRFNLGT